LNTPTTVAILPRGNAAFEMSMNYSGCRCSDGIVADLFEKRLQIGRVQKKISMVLHILNANSNQKSFDSRG